jgi:hypothetical protein
MMGTVLQVIHICNVDIGVAGVVGRPRAFIEVGRWGIFWL